MNPSTENKQLTEASVNFDTMRTDAMSIKRVGNTIENTVCDQ